MNILSCYDVSLAPLWQPPMTPRQVRTLKRKGHPMRLTASLAFASLLALSLSHPALAQKDGAPDAAKQHAEQTADEIERPIADEPRKEDDSRTSVEWHSQRLHDG